MTENPNQGPPGVGSDAVTRTVRPYAVTGGRVRSASSDLPLETLVSARPEAAQTRGLPPEKRTILASAAENYVSIAEFSALLKLPLGVVRILVSDLSDASLLTIHSTTPVDVHTGHGGANSPALSLSVLESVLNGISAL
ncbi:DUF742 domain-containing protein [Rarobacter faecitabidus]|uniref:Uncharacterized protein DUF742 n=1 Tax=Rarobacter faecitabidus TaxID=13243 RepID=A0A542ZAW9_RARFA|nr:DUF742 domain-containing protein [Rarobacter faecitabidus]TQL57498.1 uncharacterized protein DUF742 [Rarobacter faecitabidus]